uniref:C-type lectin domain-containing protein n=2 Tax=Caenorhabditis japonica TaxID=281687 RepID=A0A8R1I035_CAEJA
MFMPINNSCRKMKLSSLNILAKSIRLCCISDMTCQASRTPDLVHFMVKVMSKQTERNSRMMRVGGRTLGSASMGYFQFSTFNTLHMRLATLRFLFLLVAISVQSIFGKSPCDPAWLHIAHLDACFLSAPQPAEFDEAELFCQSYDASLVVINSEDEASIIREFFARENPSFFNWIGMRLDRDTHNFTWIDGISRDYTYFLPDEPGLSGECVAWVLDDKVDGWQAISCQYSQFFMCQKPAQGIITTWHQDDEGIITSPMWPNNYENLEYDTHIIKSEPGTRILLYFESVDTEHNCDVITVTDDYGISGRTLFRLSGSYHNHSVISTRNYVMINFKSDENVVGRGFRMLYKVLKPLSLKVFSNSFGTVASNNYPSSPGSFLIQYYLIQCSPRHHVSLQVKAIRLDRNDKVKLFNGANEKAPKLKIFRHFSTRSSEPIKSTQSNMFIAYDTGEQFSDSNHWAFEYLCVPDGNLGDEIII